jgi:hypothetical protein
MIEKTYFKTKDYCKVKFSCELTGAELIEIVGLQGDWKNPIAMKKKKNGTFTYEASLPKNSEHEFKYRVNMAEWATEPEADAQKPNIFGTSNSVLFV